MIHHCTLWPDRLGALDWSMCCAAHDLAYGAGTDKLAADLDLMICVAHAGGWPMALVMFAGVVTCGGYWFRKAKR